MCMSVLNQHSMRRLRPLCRMSLIVLIFSPTLKKFRSNRKKIVLLQRRFPESLYRILVVVLVLFMYYNRAWFANSGLRAGRDDWNARSQLNLIIDFVGRQSLEGVFH